MWSGYMNLAKRQNEGVLFNVSEDKSSGNDLIILESFFLSQEKVVRAFRAEWLVSTIWRIVISKIWRHVICNTYCHQKGSDKSFWVNYKAVLTTCSLLTFDVIRSSVRYSVKKSPGVILDIIIRGCFSSLPNSSERFGNVRLKQPCQKMEFINFKTELPFCTSNFLPACSKRPAAKSIPSAYLTCTTRNLFRLPLCSWANKGISSPYNKG